MRLVRYTPDRYPQVARVATPRSGLSHEPFVNHYYATREACQLHLLFDDRHEIAGTIGIELMPFEYGGVPHTVAVASNLQSFMPGAGGYLYVRWIKASSVAMVFGGSPETHRILRNQKWTYYSGVRTYYANWRYPAHPDERLLRSLAKTALRWSSIPRDISSRIQRTSPAAVTVDEKWAYDDSLLPQGQSPFAFRMAPSLEYLRWRYGLNLSFARYRLFSIADAGRPVGYVVIHDRKDQVVVSHADGTDAQLLAFGILKALVSATAADPHRRGIYLTSSHEQMQRIFEAAGLRPARADRDLAMLARAGATRFPPDTSRWLTNFDWGDNSLRPPFGRT